LFINPDEEPLPSLAALGPLAGIVTTFSNDKARPATAALLRQAIASDTRVAVLGWPGVGDANAVRDTFGMVRRVGPYRAAAPVQFSQRDAAIGFETSPIPGPLGFVPLAAPAASELLLQARDASGTTMDAVALTPWGGYAWPGYSIARLPAGEDEFRWVIDPIAFLRRALALPVMPVPDTTTDTGRRMLTSPARHCPARCCCARYCRATGCPLRCR
jgi:polysaccharide biosynthesis protein PelA